MAQGEMQKGESKIAQDRKHIQDDKEEVASMFPFTLIQAVCF